MKYFFLSFTSMVSNDARFTLLGTDSVILKFTTTVRGDIFCFKQFQEQSS